MAGGSAQNAHLLADHVLMDSRCFMCAMDHSNAHVSPARDFMAFQLYDSTRLKGIQEKPYFRVCVYPYACYMNICVWVSIPPMCTHRVQWRTSVLLHCSLPYCFEAGSPNEPGDRLVMSKPQ